MKNIKYQSSSPFQQVDMNYEKQPTNSYNKYQQNRRGGSQSTTYSNQPNDKEISYYESNLRQQPADVPIKERTLILDNVDRYQRALPDYPMSSQALRDNDESEVLQDYSQNSMISPSSLFSPQTYDFKEVQNQYIDNKTQEYEMTAKSGFSSFSGEGYPSKANKHLMTEMRSLISQKDQIIQNKLKALSDFKDSLTNTMTTHSMQNGPQTKESLNQTKMISGQDSASNNGRNYMAYINIQQNEFSPSSIAAYNRERQAIEFNEYGISEKIENEVNKKYEALQREVSNNSKGNSENQQSYQILDTYMSNRNQQPSEYSKYSTNIDKQDQVQRNPNAVDSRSHSFDNTKRRSEKRFFLNKLAQNNQNKTDHSSNNSRSNLNVIPLKSNEVRREDSFQKPQQREQILQQHNNQINTQTSSLITLGERKNQHFQQNHYSNTYMETNPRFTQTNDHNMFQQHMHDLNSAPTEIESDRHDDSNKQNPPHYTNDLVDIEHLEKQHKRRSSAYITSKYQTQQNQKLEEEIDQLKAQTTNQNQALNKMHNLLEQQDSNFQRQLSKSVERIFMQLETMQQQINIKNAEEDKKYELIFRKITEIKSHKRKYKKQSHQNHAKENAQNNLTQIQPIVFENQKHLNNISNNGIQIYSDIFGDDTCFLSQNGLNSAHFGEDQKSFARRNEAEEKQYSKPYSNRDSSRQPLVQISQKFQQNINNKYQATSDGSPNQSLSTQNHDEPDNQYQKVLLNNGTQKSPMTKQEIYQESLSPSTQMKPSKQTLTDNNPNRSQYSAYHNKTSTIITGHTISFNAEIDKVREESQKKITELKDFYEKELIKMREEFESRESRIKEKMQVQMKESVKQERVKVNMHMQQIYEEKSHLEHKLGKMQSRKKHHSKEKQNNSFIPKNSSQKGSNVDSDATPRSIRSGSVVVKNNYLPPPFPHLKEKINNSRKALPHKGEKYSHGYTSNENGPDYEEQQQETFNKTESNVVVNHNERDYQSRKQKSNTNSERKENASHDNQTKNQNNGGTQLALKERDIMRRISKIETYLNKV